MIVTRGFWKRWLWLGGCFAHRVGIVVQTGRGRAFQLLVLSSPPHPHGFKDVHPAPTLSCLSGDAKSFPSGRAPSSRLARRQAPKYTAQRRKRCLCVRFLPSILLVFISNVRSEAGGCGLWASSAVSAVESSGLAHVDRVGQVLLFECGPEPGLQGCNFLCLAPAFPPAPLREVQRMTMKDDPTP